MWTRSWTDIFVDDGGTSLIEYTLICAFVVIVTLGALTTLGLQVGVRYDSIAAAFP